MARRLATNRLQDMHDQLTNKSRMKDVNKTKGHGRVRSLTQRLNGKEGKLRGNNLGKRVEESARSVLTGNPDIPTGWVGIPRKAAETVKKNMCFCLHEMS
jgi:DNA-directed RNA polymerase beta' subunit